MIESNFPPSTARGNIDLNALKITIATLSMLILRALFVSGSLLAAETADGADYARDIKPLLREKCYSCHSARKQEGGLRLDAATLIRKGGDSGPAITPSKAIDSLLLQRVTARDEERMPPGESGSRLSDEEVHKLTAWIKLGASAPQEPIPESPSKHWSFLPLVKPTPPQISAGWIRSDIDRFLAAEHRRLGVAAVGEASRSMLLRRLTLDLTGLPPTRDELRNYLDDESEDAYERVVNRLLQSPRYGERWARHFMDIWRYSDPSGYGKEIRDGRQHIWRWRDWIIESLNDDKGYDRMIVEMLAADEAAPGEFEALRATGFLARNWYKFNRNVWLDNIVEHSSKAFLGLTVNCARCHEHKYDPIEQTAYYRMRAIFETHDVRDDPLLKNPAEKLVRVYDAHPDRKTFLFQQGDAKRPSDQSLTPGLPELLGELSVKPVPLPVNAWYPALKEESRAAALAAAQAKITAAEKRRQQSRLATEEARMRLAQFVEHPAKSKPIQGNSAPAPKQNGATASVVFEDDFSALHLDRWRIENGKWSAKGGRIIQTQGATLQHRLVSTEDHPQDFRAKLRIKITGGDQYRSVGFGFDVRGKAMNAVYLSVSGPKVQFTSQGDDGRWQYPAAGMAPYSVEVGRDYELEVAVKGQLLNIAIDGKHLVAYQLPSRRRAGKLSVWAFSATAEFDNLVVTTLPPGATLKPAGVKATVAPAKPETKQDFELVLLAAEANAALEDAKLKTCEAELNSLRARIEAELAKYGLSKKAPAPLANAAGKLEKVLAVARLEEQISTAQFEILRSRQITPQDAKAKKALEQHREQLAANLKKLPALKSQLEKESKTYAALGPMFPKTSSGRRLAFARWITDRRNPLTARVIVNHVWLRHFDAPLVERMFDFGLRSEQPRQHALLDWLAVQFTEDGWSLKRLHKHIVMSGAYRLRSSAADSTPRPQDPDNHSLWRMNARRMEAEVVRDSVLYLGGSLDLASGGPPIEHTRGQDVLRRSLYFRQDKERQMTFLSLFDGAKVNECYQRKPTVAPQQALAMFNSRIASQQAKKLSEIYATLPSGEYVRALYEHVLCRKPTPQELAECTRFLVEFEGNARARHQLALVLLNHNDFVTIR